MRKLKTIAIGAVSAFVVAIAPVAFVAASQDNAQAPAQDTRTNAAAAALACKRQSAANGAGQDIFLSTADPFTYTGTAWQNVTCTGTTFQLRTGERALVVADFNAEADCNGSVPTNGQWCQTRALLNGVEGSPVAAEPSSFAFDSVAGGSQNWQAHEMSRAWEVRCGLANGCRYSFVVQTRMHDATVTGMWLDEIAAHIRVTSGAPAPL